MQDVTDANAQLNKLLSGASGLIDDNVFEASHAAFHNSDPLLHTDPPLPDTSRASLIQSPIAAPMPLEKTIVISRDLVSDSATAVLALVPDLVVADLNAGPKQTPLNSNPIPATALLFATGLGTFGLLGWRRKRKAQVHRAGTTGRRGL
jgi:hypothetical protein